MVIGWGILGSCWEGDEEDEDEEGARQLKDMTEGGERASKDAVKKDLLACMSVRDSVRLTSASVALKGRNPSPFPFFPREKV